MLRVIVLVLAVALYVGNVHSLSLSDCPEGAVQDTLAVHGSSCYWVHIDQLKEWGTARESCRAEGGDLVIIKDEETQNFLVDHITNTVGYGGVIEFYIGLSDAYEEGYYEWVDNTVFNTETDYANWDEHYGVDNLHVRKDYDDCVTLDPSENFQWRQMHCETEEGYINFLFSHHKYYICEAQMAKPTPQPTCPPFNCLEDCGIYGFKVNEESGCACCRCTNDERPCPTD